MDPHDEPVNGGRAAPLEPALEELRGRLADDLAALFAAVESLNQAQADWRPAPGKWSVGETLHHLVLSDRSFALAVRKLIQRGRREGLAAGPDARRSWPRMRTIADVSASGPVRNPERVTPTHGLPIGELRAGLSAAHESVAAQIPALSGLDLEALRLPHPLGFELNLYRWVDIAGAHERRHLAQVEAIIASPGFPRG